MLEVDIDKILPVTEARDSFNKIIDDVEGTDHLYVLTKNGKPSAVVVGVNHLEKLTGKSADELTSMVEKKADSTPVVEEVTPPIPSTVEGPASGSKPPAQLPSDNIGTTPAENVGPQEPMATGPSIQPGPGPTPPPLDVPPKTSASSPQANGKETPTAPTSSPGSVPAPSAVEGAEPEAASNQAQVAPNPPTGGAATSDSDLFV